MGWLALCRVEESRALNGSVGVLSGNLFDWVGSFGAGRRVGRTKEMAGWGTLGGTVLDKERGGESGLSPVRRRWAWRAVVWLFSV